jgi:hypothetical protein
MIVRLLAKCWNDSGIRELLEQIPGLKFDHAFVKKVGKIIKRRIRMVRNHRDRKNYWRKYDSLYISISLDGAPRTKRGEQKNQLIVVLRILNENLPLERSMFMSRERYGYFTLSNSSPAGGHSSDISSLIMNTQI